MSLKIIDVEQRSPEWLEARRGIVTASTVGKLLTPTLKVADNDTSRGVIATLAAERISGYVEETRMTDDMWRGCEMEPYARDIYSSHYQQATECGFMRWEGDGWALGYSPDGLVGDDGLLEVKCPRAKTHVRTIIADEIPAHHMPQLQAGLLVSGRDWVDFVSYCSGLPLYVKRVTPDLKWMAAITLAAQQAETLIAELVATYETRTAGMPATERIDPNRVELKL